MTEKRFTTDNGSNEDVCLVDNLTKKEYESNFEDIVDLMNKTWEQTKRFEKYNQELSDENNQLKHQRHEDINELAVIAIKYKAIQSENAALEKRIHIYETTLKEAIQNERTHLGHNALKQLAENLGVK